MRQSNIIVVKKTATEDDFHGCSIPFANLATGEVYDCSQKDLERLMQHSHNVNSTGQCELCGAVNHQLQTESLSDKFYEQDNHQE